MKAQQVNMDNISNNLANVNTTGFKKGDVQFQDLLYDNLRRPGMVAANGSVLPSGIQVGVGAKVSSIQTNFSQGNLQETGNPLDLALSSDSFFAVTLSTGETVYTRDGAFRVTPDGTLVNADGLQIRFSSGNGKINNPALTTVTDTGSVLVTGQDGNSSEVGKLDLKRFLNPAGLEKIGRNLYRATEASGAPQNVDANASHVVSGFLETSNVQIADEMVKMIIAQRTYEMNSKSIQTSDDMLGIAANLKR